MCKLPCGILTAQHSTHSVPCALARVSCGNWQKSKNFCRFVWSRVAESRDKPRRRRGRRFCATVRQWCRALLAQAANAAWMLPLVSSRHGRLRDGPGQMGRSQNNGKQPGNYTSQSLLFCFFCVCVFFFMFLLPHCEATAILGTTESAIALARDGAAGKLSGSQRAVRSRLS